MGASTRGGPRTRSEGMSRMSFWYNVDTGAIETDDNRSRGANILGPYPTQEAAEHALETAHAKTEQWDQEGMEWDGKGAARGWDDEDIDD